MTDKIDDGGPAFPTEPNTQPGFYLHHGMSLRDYFAGQALPAVIVVTSEGNHRPIMRDGERTIAPAIARDAYEMADAMLAARKA